MFVFRSETVLSGSIKALFAIAFGVYLIVTKANAMTLVVQVLSAGILVMGVFPLLLSVKYPAMQPLASGAFFRILLSVLLFSFADPIASVIRYVIGGLLCLFGGSQIIGLLSMPNAFAGGRLPYLIPVLTLLGGGLFFSEELIGNDIMGMTIGAACILYGISKCVTVLKLRKTQSSSQQYVQDDTIDEQ